MGGYAPKNPMTESINTPLKDPAPKKAFHAPKNISRFYIVIEKFFKNFAGFHTFAMDKENHQDVSCNTWLKLFAFVGYFQERLPTPLLGTP